MIEGELQIVVIIFLTGALIVVTAATCLLAPMIMRSLLQRWPQGRERMDSGASGPKETPERSQDK